MDNLIRDIKLKYGKNKLDNPICDNRVKCIVRWVINNEKIINESETMRILLHIKGNNIKGEITILPDNKK